ncbi:hypothetical protein IU501_10820 [Nocardia otitidiscaviarum]|uniref:hypothetical protein n=1 Tax=Nocardia otitidiscaviarum TaxID=1823 RepID=UPI001893B1F4|nr:hypothetical protein [Nocardia otitidiscaviarum]MBF6133491.1 hypothetical protein [Nocardia otitidiscaviarum]
MTWFKIDDGFWSHPKVTALSDSAVALWVRAGAYACQHLTDGFIARSALRMLGEPSAVAELLDSGLWTEATGGFQFHDWAEYQETGEAVKRRREQARDRQRKAREAREAKRGRGGKTTPRVTASVTRDTPANDAERASGTAPANAWADTAESVHDAETQVSEGEPSEVTQPVTRDITREFSTPDPTVGRVGTTSLPSLPLSPNGDREGPRKRGTRLAEDWLPRQDTIDWAKCEHPNVDLRLEHEKFVNHWLAKSGRDAVKRDWDRTWRNWIIRASEHTARRLPAVSGMSRREQKIAAAERFKANPNPNALRRAGFHQTGLTALPGGIE